MTIGNSKEVLTFGRIKELSAVNADQFRTATQDAVSRHKMINVDLSQTTFMDCAGLGALTSLRKLALECGGSVRLMNPTPPVRRLFDLLHLAVAFEIDFATPEIQPRIGESNSADQPAPDSEQSFVYAPDSTTNPAFEVVVDHGLAKRPSPVSLLRDFSTPIQPTAPQSLSAARLAPETRSEKQPGWPNVIGPEISALADCHAQS